MKLDSRIENESLIYTPFTNTKIKLHEKGYFADDIWNFTNLEACVYGELAIHNADLQYPYGCKSGDDDYECYSFYIPESSLLEIKKNGFRPYTFEEFQKIFTIGQPIKYRCKRIESEKIFILLGYEIYEDNNPETYILIGYKSFKLDELFDEYEWQEPNSNVWKPFGVEE